MEILEYITNYWSQVSIVIFAIGYVIKTLWEVRLKEQEIKFNFIHSKRAEVIKDLYTNFSKLSKEVEKIFLAHNLSEIQQGPTNKKISYYSGKL